jgi:RHS repeat-associated protein
VYDQTSLFAEYDATGLQKAKYDYGSDRLIALTRADEGRRYFSLDGLRSVVNLSDDSGSTIASYHLDAWGNFRFPEELTASANRFAFTGHVWDQETGLYNAKARYFDPKLGRFLTQDSYLGQIDEPPSLHRYLYANDNPTLYIDPTGHYSWSEFKSDAKWGKDFIVAAGSDLVQNAPDRAVRIAGATATQATEMATETFFMAGDTVNLALGRDVPLASKLAQSSAQRLARGESAGDIIEDSAVDIGANALTVGTYGTLKEQFSAAADFMSGNMGGNGSIERLEDRLINAAGGAVLNAGLGAVGAKVAGEGWMGKPLSAPTPASVVESITQVPSRLRADAAQFKARASAAYEATSRVLNSEIQFIPQEGVASAFGVGGVKVKLSAPSKPVVAGEAGRFADLDQSGRRLRGDQLTPHHMPQVAAEFTSRAEGGALVLPHEDHVLTRTYGTKGRTVATAEAGLDFRTVLGRDLRDIRRIAKQRYGSATHYAPGIKDLIEYYRNNFPTLIERQ